MQIVQRGVAFHSSPAPGRQTCTFPGICVLPTGRWLCTCRAAPHKASDREQSVLVTWSDDEGHSWREPLAPFTPPAIAGRPGLFRAGYATALGGARVVCVLAWVDHSQPELPFFNERTEGLLDMQLFLAQSDDAGATWTPPARIVPAPFACPVPATGPLLLLPDGRWACQFELNKHYEDPVPWQHASVWLFSSDGARTWPEHVRVSDDPDGRIFYWDQRPAVLPDGRALDLFWTFDRQAARYLNIHARESRDSGRTWSAFWDTGVAGQPAPPAQMGDGRLIMVFVDRAADPIIKWRLSADGGRTWPADTEGVLYRSPLASQTLAKRSMQDAWKEMAGFTVGLPATARLPDGDILVVYYAGLRPDGINIEWARLRV